MADHLSRMIGGRLQCGGMIDGTTRRFQLYCIESQYGEFSCII